MATAGSGCSAHAVRCTGSSLDHPEVPLLPGVDSSCNYRGETRRGALVLALARPNCLRLFVHWARRAASRADCTAGNNRAIKTAMIAMTTRSSIERETSNGSRPIWRMTHRQDSKRKQRNALILKREAIKWINRAIGEERGTTEFPRGRQSPGKRISGWPLPARSSRGRTIAVARATVNHRAPACRRRACPEYRIAWPSEFRLSSLKV